MDENISFSVLEIEKTKDKEVIRDAYRKLLVKTNPEDDPEGFKRLRAAYETANAYADRQEEEEKEKPQTEVEKWMERVEDVYASLHKRLDPECWKELLNDNVCMALDTGEEARDAILAFLSEHYRIKTDIWRLLDRTFQIQEDKSELCEKFHPNFIEFILNQCMSRDDFPYEWFQGDDRADYDTFLYHYYELCSQNDRGDTDGAVRSLDTLQAMPFWHPYLELEKARFEKNRGKASEYVELIRKLLQEYGQDLRMRIFGGEVFWEAGERDASAECFRLVLEKIPEHYMANKYLAMYYRAGGEYETAKRYCVEALRLSSQEEQLLDCMRGINRELVRLYEDRLGKGEISGRGILELGWCYLQNEEPEKAVKLLQGKTVEEWETAEYHNLLSKCFFAEQEFKQAAEEAEKSVFCMERMEKDTEPGSSSRNEAAREKERMSVRIAGACKINAQSLRIQARKCKEEDQRKRLFEKALCAIDKALARVPGNRDYRIEKIQIFLDQRSFEEASAVCDEMIEEDSTDFYAYVLRQKCAYELFNAQRVVDDFYQARALYQGHAPIYELAADVFIQYGQYEDAKGILDQAKEAEVSSPKLEIQSLTILRESAGEMEEIRRACEEGRKLEQKFRQHTEQVSEENMAELFCEIARCYRGLERQKEALNYIEKALEAHEDRLYHWIRANTLYNLKRYKEALEEYQICVREYGDNETVYENLAHCCESSGNWQEAVIYFKKALEQNPENPRINGNLADIYMERLTHTGDKKYYEEALPYADRQAELVPEAYYYIERGLLHMEAGVWDKAEQDFQTAAQLEPENTYAYNNWGCVYKNQGNYTKAIELFQKSIEVMGEKPETVIAYCNLGNCFEQMGDLEQAEQWYLKGMELFPEYRSMKRDLIRIYRKMDKLFHALSAAEDYYMKETPRYCLEAGEIYAQMRDYDKALELYTHAMDIQGSLLKTEALRHCGDLMLYCRKNPQEALDYYQKALELTEKTDESYVHACRDMMECLASLGRQEEGKVYRQQALESLCLIYGSVEKYLDNIYYRRTRLYEMGALFYHTGDVEHAKYYFERIREAPRCRYCNDQGCEDYQEAMGFLLEAEGKLPEALNCFREACRESKGNHLAIARVEELEKRLGRKG